MASAGVAASVSCMACAAHLSSPHLGAPHGVAVGQTHLQAEKYDLELFDLRSLSS